MRTAVRNKEGFTLIEIMMAIIILVVGLLALMRLVVVQIDANMSNVFRDEAVMVAGEHLSKLKNSDYAALVKHGWQKESVSAVLPENPIKRKFRGVSRDFYVYTRIDDLDIAGTAKQVQVAVGWDYKGSGTKVPTNRQYQHVVSSVLTRP